MAKAIDLFISLIVLVGIPYAIVGFVLWDSKWVIDLGSILPMERAGVIGLYVVYLLAISIAKSAHEADGDFE